MKLSQYVATLKSAKNSAHQTVTAIYHRLQRGEEYVGRVRTYTPVDEAGERRPDEVQLLQSRAPEQLNDAAAALGKLFDYQAGVDFGNATATADVVVNGTTIIQGAPVPFLLFAEKQVKDWLAVLRKIPLLDPSKDWFWDANREDWFTEAVEQASTRRKTIHTVVVPATDRHPAQVRDHEEDQIVGRWRTVYRSGAMHRKDVRALVAQAEELAEALKVAREEANSQAVTSKRGTGKAVFDFLLTPINTTK